MGEPFATKQKVCGRDIHLQQIYLKDLLSGHVEELAVHGPGTGSIMIYIWDLLNHRYTGRVVILRPCLVELWLWEKAVVGCELWKSCCGL